MTSKIALFAAVCLLAACGDDASDNHDAGRRDDAGSPAVVTTAQCIDMAREMAVEMNIPDEQAAQADCLCDKCLTEVADCYADEGCTEIAACAVRTGCRGQGCYFIEPECMTVIDAWGSTGISATLAQQMQTCADTECAVGANSPCPRDTVTFQGMSADLNGCCLEGNRCGLMDDYITKTCLDRVTLGLEGLTCDGKPLPKEDAGASDDAGATDDAGSN